MIDDDKEIGKKLSRRELFGLFGTAIGGIFLVNCSSDIFGKKPAMQFLPPCVVKPELTEGPYFVDEKINRSDIRLDTKTGATRAGKTLELNFRVSRVSQTECKTLKDAMIDVWNCDALGIYSDVKDWQFDTVGQNFLRGYQMTDENGFAKFTTIYPGWYVGRAVHIHFKIRHGRYDFTSQLFFDENLTDKVHSESPYKQKGNGRTRNETDHIFQESENQLTLSLNETENGYQANFEIGIYF